jgi:hypothetical protein
MKHEGTGNTLCTRDSHLGLRGGGKEALFRAAVEMWTRRYQLTPLEATILGDAIHGFDVSHPATAS